LKPFIKYFVAAAILFAVLRFTSGRPDWTRAWLFVACTLISQCVVGVMIKRRSPDLLVERSRIREGTKSWDKIIVPIIGAVGPIATWVVAGLDIRSHWPTPVEPMWSGVAFAVLFVGMYLTSSAMLANRFFAATVRIQTDRGHKVVDHGPYAWIRHPGYAGAGVFTLAAPIAIGSWVATIPAILTVVVLIVRTALEDQTLQNELPGYKDYACRVKYRLIPGIF
jgi:protein-S-isoprenylcysteine O-methyltransferase Ste14